MDKPARYRLFIWLLAALCTAGVFFPAQAQGSQPVILVLKAEGAVAPAMGQYIERGIRTAERRGAELLVIQLNTPGGYVHSMTEIVQTIRASQVPVVVYVAPQGAMAASAGTLITLAGHASAMAPETIIGAASPVGGGGEDLNETMAAKEKEAMRALVRSLAGHRPAEAIALAEDTIQNARAVSSVEALDVGMVDFLAADLADLIRQLDGAEVSLGGQARRLSTANVQVEELSPKLIDQILDTLTNPNIVFLLITIGVQAVLIELSSPGGWAAGFIGVACLALATYSLGVLPVNWFGLVFLVLAFVLFIIDIKAPTHGALTAAGAISLIVAALVLFDMPGMPDLPGLPRISPLFVAAISATTAVSFGVIVSFAVRAQKAPVRTGQEGVVGRTGIVRTELNPRGTVQVAGELWSAERIDGQEPLPVGARVQVVRVEGITLHVRTAG